MRNVRGATSGADATRQRLASQQGLPVGAIGNGLRVDRRGRLELKPARAVNLPADATPAQVRAALDGLLANLRDAGFLEQ